MGERAFTKIQFGKETNRGTAVAATRMLLAQAYPLRPDRRPTYVGGAAGVRSQNIASYIYQYLVRDTLNVQHAYFQALPMLFSCGLKGNITPTEVTGGQGDYLWTFTPSEIAANAPDSITLEVGDDVQAFEMEHVMFERLRISGTIAQDAGASAVNIAADYFGRQISPVSFTTSLSLPTPEFINAKLARFYLNTAWASVGNTELANILRAFDIEILTGVHPVFSGDANKYFKTYGEGPFDFMANFTFEGNSDADAIWDAQRSQALQVARLKINGSQIGTGTTHSLVFDLGGTWDEVTPLSSEDRGNNLHTAILRSKYDATGEKKLQLTVTTSQATI